MAVAVARAVALPPEHITFTLDSFRATEPGALVPGALGAGTCTISFDVRDDGTLAHERYTLYLFDSIDRVNEAWSPADPGRPAFAPAIVRLPELRAALYAFPHDPGLSHLADCLAPAAASAALGAEVAAVTARPLKHDPGRGCTLAVDVRTADGRLLELVAKTHRGDRLERTHDTMARLAAAPRGADWSFPRALGYDRDRRLLWQERARGAGFWDAAASLDLDRVFTAMARATAAMHATPFAPAERRAPAPDPSREQRALARRAPGLARRHEALWRRLGPAPALPTVALHGDLHPHQFLVDGAHVALTDFDKACWGHPGDDVGCFVSHVLLKSIEWELDSARYAGALETYLAAYREAAPAAGDGCGIWHTAAHLLGRRTRKLVARGASDAAIGRLLDHAEAWVERATPA